MRRAMMAAWVLVVVYGCDGANGSDGGPARGDAAPSGEPHGAMVRDAPGAGSGMFGDPGAAANGVRGGGGANGSLDVYSIPYGSHLVVDWAGRRVSNGPGADVVVFENPFAFGEGSTFMDPTIVEVSLDGEQWVALPHDYVAADEDRYSPRAGDWVGFAGVVPVLLHADDNPVDPFETAAAGGDAFDLDALADEGEPARVRREGFALLRLTPAADRTNPDTGSPYPRDPASDGPDIDGVIARYVVDAP